MPRPIDADALKAILERYRECNSALVDDYSEGKFEAYSLSIAEINDAPTVEPEKPNGGWIHDGADYEDGKVTAIYVSHELHGLDRAKFVPDRPHGEWVWKEYDPYYNCGDIVCSNCSCVILEGVPSERLENKLWDYCPCCGSDNRPKGDENNA